MCHMYVSSGTFVIAGKLLTYYVNLRGWALCVCLYLKLQTSVLPFAFTEDRNSPGSFYASEFPRIMDAGNWVSENGPSRILGE